LTSECADGRSRLQTEEIELVLKELTALRAGMVAESAVHKTLLDVVHPNFRDSASNLLHYLALRRHDLRPLQLRLAALGLSSLGRAESHVLSTVDAVLDVLHRLTSNSWRPPPSELVDFSKGRRLLSEHTENLLGPSVPGRGVRIMVTMPSEAAHDYTLVHDLLQHGMDCMRINCAHDDAATWARMIEHLHRAQSSLNRSCRIVMDLAGPNLRTGPIEPGPAVVRVRPRRDVCGRVVAPARVWLTSATLPHLPPSPADASLSVSATWLAGLSIGERVKFTDARQRKRVLGIVEASEGGCWAETNRTAYVVPGTVLRYAGNRATRRDRESPVGDLPTAETALSLYCGDLLILSRSLKPGRPATLDGAGRVLTPARIGCTIPEALDDVRPGESIWFDDGKLGGVIEEVQAGHALVRINHAPPNGGKLRADKGINLPESDLQLGALTDKDLEDLSFVTQHADVVELSFSNVARDVELLEQYLAPRRSPTPAIVLKIETRRGFENLPDMLLMAMRWPCCGVMIARGDLAVECGFERLAEVQEEILWICEAAHVPVIWATQVLETLAKKGMPSRAEITDAAMADRAECVMLNKGPHVLSAVRVLDDILRRMQAHQTKKRAMLRELRLAHALPTQPGAAAERGHHRESLGHETLTGNPDG